MASPYEVEVKLLSAKNLKNVNWRNGPNLPYVVVWVDPAQKRSTNVDNSGDTQPNWNEKLITPMPPSTSINNCIVFIDVLHLESNNKPPLIIGSTQLPLNGIKIDDLSGVNCTLMLKRPSGRPQGTVDVKVIIKNLAYHTPYGVPPYGSPYCAAPGASLSVTYGNPYNVAPPPPVGYDYPIAAPTYVAASRPRVGYPAAPASAPYAYGQSIQQGTQQGESEKSSQFGLGTGLAVGAGAGLAVGVVVGGVGALALGKDKEAEKVENVSYYDHEVSHHHEVESDAYYEHVEEASHVEEANVNYEYPSHVEEANVVHVEETNANVYYEEYTSHAEEASNVEEANVYYEEYAPEIEEESYVEEANAYYEEEY